MKEVVPCDVFKDPVMGGYPDQPFDAIVTSFCLESCVFNNYEGYKIIVKRLVNILKLKGHLFIATMLRMTYYKVGDQIIPTQTLSEAQHSEALTDAGLKIKTESLYTSSDEDLLNAILLTLALF